MAECATPEAAPVSTTPETPITLMPIQAGIDSKEIHRRAVGSYTTSQRARYEHIFYLRLVDVRGVYTLEKYSGMVHYCEALFGYSSRMTKDLLRVGETLERFPKLAEAFKRGEIEYSKVREITRVVDAGPFHPAYRLGNRGGVARPRPEAQHP